jgi:hypothetical protein
METTESLLLRILWQIQKTGPVRDTMGICGNVRKLLYEMKGFEPDNVLSLMYRIMENWPNAVEPAFPVEGSEIYLSRDDKWVGEYGRRRKELLQYMIDELKKEI